MKILLWSIYFSCLLFVINTPCFAKEISLDTIKIDSSSDSLWKLDDQQLWVFCDTTHLMSYEDVQILPLNAFRPTKNGKYNLNRQHANHYWFKFIIQNLHPIEDLDLVFNVDRTDFGTLYQKTGKDKAVVLNSDKKRTYKDGYITYSYIPIKLPANQISDFLFRNETIVRAFSKKNLLLLSKRKFQQEKVKNIPRQLTFNLFQGTFFGFLTFAIMFALIQFTAEKDKVYLYYSTYVLSIVGYYLMNVPYLNLALTFNYSFAYGNPFAKIITFINIGFYVLFLRAFLGINKQNHKRLATIMNVLQTGLFLLITGVIILRISGYHLVYAEFHGQIRVILTVIGFYLITPIFFVSRNKQYSVYIILGTLFLLVSGLLNNLFVNGKEHFIRNYMTFTQIGILGEILFFSLALSLRSRGKLRAARTKEIATNQQLYQAELAKIDIQKDKAFIQQQLAETELKALKAQLNPHFISNALNGIKLMVQCNQKKQAEDYLADFSNLIRTILINSNGSFISLQRELDYAALYLKIESLRFDNQFNYKIEVDEEIDATYVKIPPLLLQPYIENAIWHGLLPKKGLKKLLIKVQKEAHEIICIIEDNGVGRKAKYPSKKDTKYPSKSYGMSITSDRIKINNDLYEAGLSINIIDKINPAGMPEGTVIQLTMPN